MNNKSNVFITRMSVINSADNIFSRVRIVTLNLHNLSKYLFQLPPAYFSLTKASQFVSTYIIKSTAVIVFFLMSTSRITNHVYQQNFFVSKNQKVISSEFFFFFFILTVRRVRDEKFTLIHFHITICTSIYLF